MRSGATPNFAFTPSGSEALVGHGVDHVTRSFDELGEVLVARGDQRLARAPGGVDGQRADHVVGLDAIDHQHRPAEGRGCVS